MKLYRCELCQKLFCQKSNLLNHVKRKFKCVNTDITTYTISDLVKIEKTENEKKEIIEKKEITEIKKENNFFDSCQIIY